MPTDPMPIYFVTAQQHANLLEARNVMWPSIKPEQVAHHLNSWKVYGDDSCGTASCFGGWCATWPAFQAQGVKRSGVSAAPFIGNEHGDVDEGYEVAHILFGLDQLFWPRGSSPLDRDTFGMTDHDLVTHRLDTVLNNCVIRG